MQAIAKYISFNIMPITCLKSPGATLLHKVNPLKMYNPMWVLISSSFEYYSST